MSMITSRGRINSSCTCSTQSCTSDISQSCRSRSDAMRMATCRTSCSINSSNRSKSFGSNIDGMTMSSNGNTVSMCTCRSRGDSSCTSCCRSNSSTATIFSNSGSTCSISDANSSINSTSSTSIRSCTCTCRTSCCSTCSRCSTT